MGRVVEVASYGAFDRLRHDLVVCFLQKTFRTCTHRIVLCVAHKSCKGCAGVLVKLFKNRQRLYVYLLCPPFLAQIDFVNIAAPNVVLQCCDALFVIFGGHAWLHSDRRTWRRVGVLLCYGLQNVGEGVLDSRQNTYRGLSVVLESDDYFGLKKVASWKYQTVEIVGM